MDNKRYIRGRKWRDMGADMGAEEGGIQHPAGAEAEGSGQADGLGPDQQGAGAARDRAKRGLTARDRSD